MRERATIYALSSGRPPAGVAVIRMSGPGALDALARLAGGAIPARRAVLRRLRHPVDGHLLDEALVLAFPGPASVTGEDVAELHLHGGVAVVTALLGALGGLDGLRLAEPGEFSRRAFDNGRLDLSQAEGLADLIDAQTETQRVQALAQAGGRLRARCEAWRATLLGALAALEAEIDFAEEERDVVVADVTDTLAVLHDEIVAHLSDRGGERVREGVTIAVIGAPNVGKSSIVNRLARSDVAIVAATPGTTRDVIAVALDLGGMAATLVDTAGLRDTDDPIEAEGIRRARARAAAADLVIEVVTEPVAAADGHLLIVNKIDLSGRDAGAIAGGVALSAFTGDGFDAFEALLRERVAALATTSESAIITRVRHRDALDECARMLEQASHAYELVLRSEAVRLANRALGRITGHVNTEVVLDEIFGRFCIGK